MRNNKKISQIKNRCREKIDGSWINPKLFLFRKRKLWKRKMRNLFRSFFNSFEWWKRKIDLEKFWEINSIAWVDSTPKRNLPLFYKLKYSHWQIKGRKIYLIEEEALNWRGFRGSTNFFLTVMKNHFFHNKSLIKFRL